MDVRKPSTRSKVTGWSRRTSPIVLLIGLIGLCGSARADVTAERLLATRHLSQAFETLGSADLTLTGLEAAVLLIEEAATLQPEDPEVWRELLRVAELAERDELRDRAIEHLSGLAPDDQVIQWRRLTRVLDGYQTADERVTAYTELLTVPDRLDPVVASRLAFDLALLQQRRGDEVAFADWLGKSIALDTGNRGAAALAAGYFRAKTNDPVEEAQLLLNVLLADPVDLGTHVELARLLLDNGAYAAAARMLVSVAAGRTAVAEAGSAELFGDLALAHWGRGDAEAALATLARYSRENNLLFRDRLSITDPDLTPLDIARRSAPSDPTLATIRLAISADRSEDERADAWTKAMEAFDEARETFDGSDSNAAELAQLLLQQAFVIIYFGPDTSSVPALVDEAAALIELSEDARSRFAGWVQLRNGELEAAIETLTPLADEDELAKLGIALARRQLGDTRECARALLAVARSRPGALVGVAAATQLFDLLGRQAPITDSARTLNELIDEIPAIFDRYASDARLCVSLRLRPVKSAFLPYEPIVVELDLLNTSPYPLAIDRNGPLRPQVVFEASIQVPAPGNSGGGVIQAPPLVVDIDRALSLRPREHLVVPIDLGRTYMGAVFRGYATSGVVVSLKATTNFRARQDDMSGTIIYLPGPLGVSATTGPIRIEGIRPTAQWINEVLADAVQSGKPKGLIPLAMLSNVALRGLAQETLDDDQRRLLRDSVTALIESFERFDPAAQAWLIATLPRTEGTEPIFTSVAGSPSRTVKLAYLIHCVTGLDDPILEAASSDDDPVIRHAADLYKRLAAEREE